MTTYEILCDFERGLDPSAPESSSIPGTIVGYGEISTIFTIEQLPDRAFKRLPIFHTESEAQEYVEKYVAYCEFLSEAGILLPEDETHILEPTNIRRPWVLYIVQKKMEPGSFIHIRARSSSTSELALDLNAVIRQVMKVWDYNQDAARSGNVELALDGQLSNWVYDGTKLVYVDTGTPLFRLDKEEQLDPEPLLASAPFFLRWILRAFFLDDVMTRYYDLRLVCMDMLANLFKEQRPDLIETATRAVNEACGDRIRPIEVPEVAGYYRGDRRIWSLFLVFRKIDRWLRKVLPLRRYEFILPGPIKR